LERHRVDNNPRLNLSMRPVVSVESVVDPKGCPVDWKLLFNRTSVMLSDPMRAAMDMGTITYYRRVACSGPAWVDVTYRHGRSEPPLAVQQAISTLAGEFQLASSGEPCKLPERVTSVTRQGVSWTMLDPQDFLADGRTGLYEVDSVLAAYNAGTAVRARAAVYSPEFRPPARIWSVVDSGSHTCSFGCPEHHVEHHGG